MESTEVKNQNPGTNIKPDQTEVQNKSKDLKHLFENTRYSSMKELTTINPWFFTSRLIIFMVVTSLGIAGIIFLSGYLKLLCIVLTGLMYAHAIELQHQALHYTAYTSKSLNRFVGVILGIPMLVSFTDYQVHHWSHHKNLGTSANKEFFNYSYEKLRSPFFLIPHLLMVYHYIDVVKYFSWSLIGKLKNGMSIQKAKDIRSEYLLLFFTILAVAGLSAYYQSNLALFVWFYPLLIAIPVHALIELPEHLGCPQLSTDPFENTRTIQSTLLGKWFTNYNNYHVEHHFLPGVPNDKVQELHRAIQPKIIVLEKSFAGFYYWFIKELVSKGEFDSIKKFKHNNK